MVLNFHCSALYVAWASPSLHSHFPLAFRHIDGGWAGWWSDGSALSRFGLSSSQLPDCIFISTTWRRLCFSTLFFVCHSRPWRSLEGHQMQGYGVLITWKKPGFSSRIRDSQAWLQGRHLVSLHCSRFPAKELSPVSCSSTELGSSDVLNMSLSTLLFLLHNIFEVSC